LLVAEWCASIDRAWVPKWVRLRLLAVPSLWNLTGQFGPNGREIPLLFGEIEAAELQQSLIAATHQQPQHVDFSESKHSLGGLARSPGGGQSLIFKYGQRSASTRHFKDDCLQLRLNIFADNARFEQRSLLFRLSAGPLALESPKRGK
jgi:hypothetical protein